MSVEVTVMVSSAIVSVDAWISQAEELLAELREQGLSPSSAPCRNHTGVDSTITLADFAEGLEGVLRSLCECPGRWILIAEDARRHHHFWQAIAYEDGSLYVEFVSNYYLEGDELLTDADGRWLESQGWKVPDPPKWPNWARVEATTSPAVGEVAQQAVEAIREVFGLGDEDLVRTKLFSSAIRGDSPASPDPRDETVSIGRATGSTGGHQFPVLDEAVAADAARAAEFVEGALGSHIPVPPSPAEQRVTADSLGQSPPSGVEGVVAGAASGAAGGSAGA
jgi:hypothetical protein